MDNLKFSAEMMLIETEGVSEQKNKSLVVQTITRNKICYKAIINNPDIVQYPKKFLMPDMAIESIISYVSSEPPYTYYEKLDIIELRYNVIGTNGICIQLKKDLTQMPTIEQRITAIELLLETLVLDELIESHLYPSWETYEQFTKLPSYKYFDAFHNAQRYFNKEPVMHLGKFKQYYYGLDAPHSSFSKPLSFQCGNNTDQEKKQYIESLTEFVKPCTMTQNKEYELTTSDVNFYSTLYKQTRPNTNTMFTDQPRDYFQSSLKTFVNKNTLCHIINEYFRMYITGFYLINHQLLIGRNIRIEIHINDEKMHLHIFRSKKIRFSHHDPKTPTCLTMQHLINIKIDGIYVAYYFLNCKYILTIYMVLVLLRNAATTSNGSDLTPLGYKQALALLPIFANHFEINYAFTSPAPCCTNTALLCINGGISFLSGIDDIKGTDTTALIKAIQMAKSYTDRGKNILFVTHESVIKYILKLDNGQIPNCSINVIRL